MPISSLDKNPMPQHCILINLGSLFPKDQLCAPFRVPHERTLPIALVHRISEESVHTPFGRVDHRVGDDLVPCSRAGECTHVEPPSIAEPGSVDLVVISGVKRVVASEKHVWYVVHRIG